VNVAVVIVNYHTPDLTRRCLTALRSERERLPQLKAVIVDGGSGDASAEELATAVADPEFASWVSLLPLPINGGFGWANNQAILALARETAPPDYVHLLNPDAEVMAGAVAALVEELEAHPRCGAAGSQLLTSEGRPAASAFRFPSPGREFTAAAQTAKLGRLLGVAPTVVEAAESVEVDWVTGASVMFRAAALRDTGLFDDGFFLYFEEVELMHRMRDKGWTARHVPWSRVVHLEGASTGLGAAAVRPLPPYWYQSRRRYFLLTGGRTAALAADAAWLAGRAVSLLKGMLRRAGRESGARASQLFRTREIANASVPKWGDEPGRPPAWMAGV
jgi:hypothetical protein